MQVLSQRVDCCHHQGPPLVFSFNCRKWSSRDKMFVLSAGKKIILNIIHRPAGLQVWIYKYKINRSHFEILAECPNGPFLCPAQLDSVSVAGGPLRLLLGLFRLANIHLTISIVSALHQQYYCSIVLREIELRKDTHKTGRKWCFNLANIGLWASPVIIGPERRHYWGSQTLQHLSG